MNARSLVAGVVGALIILAGGVSVLSGQGATSAPSAGAPAFSKDVQPFLAKNCYLCHNEKLTTAGLNLSAYTTESTASKKPELWDQVLEKISTGKMPPAGRPVPSKAELAPVTAWIEDVLNRAGFSKPGDPGRITARRLNRVEYSNTIHDLLGVAAHPADDFPVDDSGYGFDNNGDVLSVSPLLMEKYLAAAKNISRLAVYGGRFPPSLRG